MTAAVFARIMTSAPVGCLPSLWTADLKELVMISPYVTSWAILLEAMIFYLMKMIWSLWAGLITFDLIRDQWVSPDFSSLDIIFQAQSMHQAFFPVKYLIWNLPAESLRLEFWLLVAVELNDKAMTKLIKFVLTLDTITLHLPFTCRHLFLHCFYQIICFIWTYEDYHYLNWTSSLASW